MTHTIHTHAFHTNVGAVPATELARRRDLRQTRHIVSIDPPGCQDIDDALSVHLLANGNYEIGVHIADVTGRECTADFSVVGITFLFCQGLLFCFVRVYSFLFWLGLLFCFVRDCFFVLSGIALFCFGWDCFFVRDYFYFLSGDTIFFCLPGTQMSLMFPHFFLSNSFCPARLRVGRRSAAPWDNGVFSRPSFR
jgi:hypothetical protein